MCQNMFVEGGNGDDERIGHVKTFDRVKRGE